MKRMIRVFTMTLAIGVCGILTAAAPVSEPLEEKCSNEEDALYCSVTVDGNTATCWFCDCKELVESLK